MSDPFEGQGGSYRVDPESGRRELVERTQEPPAPEPPSPSGGRAGEGGGSPAKEGAR